MRLYEIEDTELKLEISQFKRFVEEHCSDFFNQIKGSNLLLYRGFSTVDDKRLHGFNDILFGKSREDRRPRSRMSSEFQKIYDNYLKSKGIKALRSNSIPTINDLYATMRFGTPYMVFPCNGFEWSTQDARDVGASEEIEISRASVDSNRLLDVDKVATLKDDWGIQYNWDKSWSANEYAAYLKPENANRDAEYLDIDYYFDQNKMNSYLDQHFAATNKNLVEAMNSKNEILISGSYYALKATRHAVDEILHWIK